MFNSPKTPSMFSTYIRLDAENFDLTPLNAWKVLEGNMVLPNVIKIDSEANSAEKAIKMVYSLGLGRAIQNHITFNDGLDLDFYLRRIA